MGVIRKRRGKTNSKVTVPEPASVNNYGREVEADRSFYTWINIVVGLIAMTACGYIHALFMYTLHENNMWFTNIQVIEYIIASKFLDY